MSNVFEAWKLCSGIDGVYLLRQKAATQRRDSFEPTALKNRPLLMINILGFFNRGIQTDKAFSRFKEAQ